MPIDQKDPELVGQRTERIIRVGLAPDRLIVGVEDRAELRLAGRREEPPHGAFIGTA